MIGERLAPQSSTGRRTRESTARSPGRATRLETLRVLSYNVWFDQAIDPLARYRAILAILESERADLISLHGVTPGFMRMLMTQRYVLAHADPDAVRGYCTMGLSRVAPRSITRLPLPSIIMGRALVATELDLGDRIFVSKELASRAPARWARRAASGTAWPPSPRAGR